MSELPEVPSELRDYVAPLLQIGHVTPSLFDSMISEGVRLGLSQAESARYVRALAEESGASVPRGVIDPEEAPEAPSSVEASAETAALPQPAPRSEAPASEAPASEAPASEAPASAHEPAASRGEQALAAPADAEPGAPVVVPPLSSSGERATLRIAGEPQEAGLAVPDEAPESGAAEPEPALAAALPEGGWRGIPVLHLAPGLLPFVAVVLALLGGAPEKIRASYGGGDPYEPNGTVAEAKPLAFGVHPGLILSSQDVDWFRIEVPAGKALSVKVDNAPQDGGLTLHGPKGVQLSTSGDKVSYLLYVPEGLRGETVLLRCYGALSVPYTLTTEAVDPRQRFEPNDERGEAVEVHHTQRVEALSCDGRDWFEVVVPAWHALDARLLDSAEGLSLVLHEESDPPDGPAQGISKQGRLAAGPLPRRAWIEVVGQGDYGLELSKGDYDEDLARASGTFVPTLIRELEPNDSQEEAVAIGPGRYPKQRCDGDDWYRVDIPAKSTISCEINQGRLALSLKAKQGVSPFGRTLDLAGDRQRRVYYSEDPQTALIHVRGRGRYDLEVKVTPGMPGRPLPPGSYPQITGSGDDLYRIEVASGQELTVDVTTLGEGYNYLQCELYGLALPGQPRGPQRPRKRRGGPPGASWFTSLENTYVHGYGSLTRRFERDQSVWLWLRGERMSYDLRLRLEGSAPLTRAGDFAPNKPSEWLDAGIYSQRSVADESYHTFWLRRDQSLTAIVRFVHQVGDVDVELLDSRGEPVSESSTEQDVERLSYVSPVDQPVFLRVYTYAEQPVPYDVEALVDGEQVPQARPLQPGQHRGLVCAGRVNYSVPLRAGQTLRAALRFDPRQGGELDLGLLDGAGAEVARSAGLGESEELSYRAQRDEAVILRVYGKAKRFDLDLDVTGN